MTYSSSRWSERIHSNPNTQFYIGESLIPKICLQNAQTTFAMFVITIKNGRTGGRWKRKRDGNSDDRKEKWRILAANTLTAVLDDDCQSVGAR